MTRDTLRSKPSIFRKIKWKLDAAWTFVRNIPSNIKMICEWIPVLWNNWDWDYNFLLTVMRYKMSRMATHIREHDILVRSNEIADELEECCVIISRLQENDYTKEEDIAHRNKWGKCRMGFLPYEDSNCSQLDMYNEKARKMGKDEEAKVERLSIIDLGYEREQADYKKLFEIMRDKIQGWWD